MTNTLVILVKWAPLQTLSKIGAQILERIIVILYKKTG